MRDLSLHVMDITQNSISANANNIILEIYTCENDQMLTVNIEDDGDGMDEDMLKVVTDPFVTSRTTRRVGLGISMFKQSAELAEGSFEIASQLGRGTKVKAIFKNSHIDRLPLGDISQTFSNLIMAYPNIDFKLVLRSRKDEFQLSTIELKKTLQEVPINNLDVINWINENIDESIKCIFGGVLNEISS